MSRSFGRRLCEELGDGPLASDTSSLRRTGIHGNRWRCWSSDELATSSTWSERVRLDFVDLPTFLQRADDESARESMLDAYLEAWTDLASLEELRAAYELALPLAYAHHAISYLRITDALEPDDRWWFEDEPKRWLAGALELLEPS